MVRGRYGEFKVLVDGKHWLMAAPWQPWACSPQGGKCSMPFGRHSPADRLSMIGQAAPGEGDYSCLTPH